jgi:DNA-binding transcriptional regulator YiaG
MTPDDIKSARLLAGLGRREFARRVGVSDVSVWKWETGKNQPTDEHWRAIEAVLRAKQTFDQACKDTRFLTS